MEQQSYAEASVKRQPTTKTYVLKGLIVFAIVFIAFITFFAGIIYLTPVLAAAIVFAFYYFPKFNQEYEVVFCDGQFDFDRIAGSRKTLLRMDMDDIDVIAPLGHESVANVGHAVIKKDYSGGNQEKTYVIIGGSGEKRYQVYFEPSEKMLECIHMKSPSKLKRR